MLSYPALLLPSNMSCSLCQSILLRHWYAPEEELPWLRCGPNPHFDCHCVSRPLFSHSLAKDMATLWDSAAKGCQFCRMLAANLLRRQGETSSRDSKSPDPKVETRLTLVPSRRRLLPQWCHKRSKILGPISQYALLATCGNHESDGLEFEQIAQEGIVVTPDDMEND